METTVLLIAMLLAGGEDPGAVGTVSGGSGPPVDATSSQVHWSQVKPMKRVRPTWPLSVTAKTNLFCYARFFIDTSGVPVEVRVEDGCPAPFVDALNVLGEWRFHPYEEGGVAVDAQFVLQIQFCNMSHRKCAKARSEEEFGEGISQPTSDAQGKGP